ncbi:MAG: cupin domain-containing protein [Dehalococcoidia bacterium]|nr:cupin domain-containing protein [Dehalococcoidia bacterium]
MSADELLTHITPSQRVAGDPTPGMTREAAHVSDGLWSGIAFTEPGMTSGWHHHGEYETVIYVASGGLRMEAGPDGTQLIEAGPGDFVYVPPGAVHREGNPSAEQSELVVVRTGHGPAVTNVDGPARS